jgi:hypothetical protein
MFIISVVFHCHAAGPEKSSDFCLCGLKITEKKRSVAFCAVRCRARNKKTGVSGETPAE